MDILYIVKGGATGGTDDELRCSLRSLARYGRGVGRVFVAGGPPAWLSDAVVRVPFEQGAPVTAFNDKGRNILRTTLHALEVADIGEDFLVSMDDHYLGAPVDFDAWPYYARADREPDGMLPREDGWPGSYREYLYQTRLALEAWGLPCWNMALHRNMHCARRWIAGAAPMVDALLAGEVVAEPWVLLGNWAVAHEGITPVLARDVKYRDRMSWRLEEDRPVCWSTEDFPFGGWMHRALLDAFPQKSIYER